MEADKLVMTIFNFIEIFVAYKKSKEQYLLN